jgi:catalase
MNNHRDGQMRHRITKGKINYYPNRKDYIPAAKPSEGAYWDYPEKIVAMKQRLHSTKFSEHYNQAQLFWNSQSPIEKQHIINALSFELDRCDDPIVYERMNTRLADIALDLAQAVAEKSGGPIPQEGRANHGRSAKGLSMFDFTPEAQGIAPTIMSRQVAILIGENFNFAEYEAMKGLLSAAGAVVFTIGPKRQPVKSAGGKSVAPDHHFEGMRSTIFDSLYIPGGEHVRSLMKEGRVVHYIREAFGHCKAIGATGEAVQLVQYACNVDGMAFSTTTDVVDSYGVVTAGGLGNGGIVETLKMAKGAKNFADAYTYAISQHRNFQRELDGLTSQVAY